MKLVATDAVKEKIWTEHEVYFQEAEEAFENSEGPWFEDDRAKNQTRPKTIWTLAFTDLGRLIKIVVIKRPTDAVAVLRTAYEPDEDEVKIYETNC